MKTDDEMSGALLARLAQALEASEGVDAELAAIVVQHIVTSAPAEDCVERAMTAINKLATARVAPTKENVDGQPSLHS